MPMESDRLEKYVGGKRLQGLVMDWMEGGEVIPDF